MIPNIAQIAEYNPAIHTKPIVWFRSKLLTNLRIGGTERVSSSVTVGKFPENSIVVKVARGHYNKTNNINGIGLVQIYFTGALINRGTFSYSPLKRVLLWRDYNNSTEINRISFTSSSSGADNSIDGMTEMLTYINYIIKQLNTL